MADLPILFSGDMIRAIIAGNKTQTRRLLNPQPDGWTDEVISVRLDGLAWPISAAGNQCGGPINLPRISKGDCLYVREEFSGPHHFKPKVNPPREWPTSTPIWYWADGNPEDGDWSKPKPGMHLPRWASRITLIVEDVRIERLQDISAEDAIAEGIEKQPYEGSDPQYRESFAWRDYSDHPHAVAGFRHDLPAKSYESLWDKINGAGAWELNPWVVAYTFCTEMRNIDNG